MKPMLIDVNVPACEKSWMENCNGTPDISNVNVWGRAVSPKKSYTYLQADNKAGRRLRGGLLFDGDTFERLAVAFLTAIGYRITKPTFRHYLIGRCKGLDYYYTTYEPRHPQYGRWAFWKFNGDDAELTSLKEIREAGLQEALMHVYEESHA